MKLISAEEVINVMLCNSLSARMSVYGTTVHYISVASEYDEHEVYHIL